MPCDPGNVGHVIFNTYLRAWKYGKNEFKYSCVGFLGNIPKHMFDMLPFRQNIMDRTVLSFLALGPGTGH